MHYLKLTWKLMGLEAPVFSWLVVVGLISLTAIVLYRHWRSSKLHAEQFQKVSADIEQLYSENARKPGEGVSIKTLDGLRQVFEQFLSLRPIWLKIESRIIRRPGRAEEDEYWMAESAHSILAESVVVDTHWLKNTPGIVTSVGLLATFLAILVALVDVRLINNRVQGLDLLIQGLSGKFLSSVVALMCAVIFLAIERYVGKSANSAFSLLVERLDETIPCITSAQILSDLHKDISKQSESFRIFNADLSFKLKQSFGESVNRTLDRMVTAIDNLSALLRAAEAEKHKSMTDELGGLLGNFNRGIQAALEELGTKFNATLTGSAQTQFGEVIESLGSTALLLKEMNNQFSVNQGVLSDLIQLAKETTTNQMSQGQTQVEELSTLLKQLMVQMEERTGQSLGSVQQTLAAVTLDISNKVTDISVQMASMVEETTDKSTQAAQKIIEEAGSLSTRSAENLERLLEKHSAEVMRVEDLSSLLDNTIKGFANSLGKYGEVTNDLNKLMAEINYTVKSISAISKSIKDSEEEAAKVSKYAAEQAAMLKGFVQGQKDTWDKIQGSMVEYRNIFGTVDEHAKALLNNIGEYLQDYSEITQGHFGKLGALANEHMDNAVKRISGSIEDLAEQLDELQTIVSGITKYTRKAGQ
jgi:hypothetical protein